MSQVEWLGIGLSGKSMIPIPRATEIHTHLTIKDLKKATEKDHFTKRWMVFGSPRRKRITRGAFNDKGLLTRERIFRGFFLTLEVK